MIGVKWTGWDGSVWDLNTGRVRLTDDGIEGLSMLASEAFSSETALSDGQRLTGWRAKPRKVLLPVLIGQELTERAWLDLEKQWWKTMRPDKAGTLELTMFDGTQRELRIRFESDGGMPMRHDPSRNRLTVAPLVMVADKPWWLTRTIVREFRNGGNGENFFGGDTNHATPFFIAPANSVGKVSLQNPGDMPAYPVYRLVGQVLSFRVVIDGRPVGGLFDIDDSQSIRIETSPDTQVAYLIDGDTKTNITRQLSEVEFMPVPAGESVELGITISGTGSLFIEYTPRHFRAWG